MKELVSTTWFIHGESGLSPWLLLVILAAALYLLLRWLRAERRRRSVPTMLLPVTGCTLLVLCAWLIWSPSYVRVSEWRHAMAPVVCLDTTESMGMPLATKGLSAALDALELTAPAGPATRITAPRALLTAARAAAQAGARVDDDLQALRDALEQQVPPGADALSRQDAYAAWAAALRTNLLSAVESVAELAAGAPAATGEGGSLATQLADLAALVDKAPRAIASLNSDDLAAALRAIAALRTALDALAAPLAELQESLDGAFVAEQGESFAPVLAQARATTRRDAAAALIAQTGLALPPADTNAVAAAGDVFADLDAILKQHEDGTLADVVLLSDGGHRGDVRTDLASKLASSGVRLTAVGVGMPENDADLSILDWELPGLAQEKKPVTLRAQIKTPLDRVVPFTVTVNADGVDLPSTTFTTDGSGRLPVMLTFTAPAAGRHVLRVRIQEPDANPANNTVACILDTVNAEPRTLLLGDMPDWDTAYLHLAAQAAGLRIDSLYHATGKEALKRGGSSLSIPETLRHWSRFRLVVLHGATFAGFQPGDADTLFEYVAKEGGSLLIFPGGADGYLGELAARFGWTAQTAALADRHLTPAPGAGDLPLLRLGTDAPATAAKFEALGACGAAWQVPGQHLPLLHNADGATLLSVGFYGRGKVYLCGLNELQAISEYANAPVVDRFLRQLLVDAAAPLFASADDTLTTYPGLLVAGTPNVVLSLSDGAAQLKTAADSLTVPLTQGPELFRGFVQPPAPGDAVLEIGAATRAVAVIRNPGLEQIYYEFDAGFLRDFADAAQGRYVALRDAAAALRQLTPHEWHESTAHRTPLAGHWAMALAIAAVGALHWVLRKLAGLAI